MSGTTFPTSYAEGRSQFVDLVSASNGTLESHEHPLPGPADEQLFLDVGSWGDPGAATAVVLVAGTHGIEGFAGSGIMATLLGEGLHNRTPDNVKLMMIHALNPHGFAWERRVNEDNIDLNRNFVDHDSRYPDNPHYGDLAGIVTPRRWAPETPEEITTALGEFKQQHGVSATAVLSMGQYEYPDGFFYGGNAPAWSNTLLAEIAAAHLTTTEHVYDIDIHTGLGPFGHGEYIVECAPESRQYQISEAIWGDGLRSTVSGASRSPKVSGSAMSGLKAVLGDRLAGMGLEFGTVPMTQVMEALIADRWLTYHGERNSELGEQIRAKMRAAFYPDSEEWQTAITTCARLVVHQALDYAAG
ncbi:MAG: M14 family metallopeptidase [Gammaproteobacteria bacterium]|nr:M14 family metallopeptidase [Gammaproteobacteria bacterium]